MPEKPVFISFIGNNVETECLYRAVVERLQAVYGSDICWDLGDPLAEWKDPPEDMLFLDAKWHVLSRWIQFREYLQRLRICFAKSYVPRIFVTRRFGCDLVADSVAAAGPQSSSSWHTILGMHSRLVQYYITDAGITPPLYFLGTAVSAKLEEALARYFYEGSGQCYDRIPDLGSTLLKVDFVVGRIARERDARSRERLKQAV